MFYYTGGIGHVVLFIPNPFNSMGHWDPIKFLSAEQAFDDFW